MEDRMAVYAIWNNKGGVGKSYLTFQIACEYARQHPDARKQRDAQHAEGEGLVGATGPAMSDKEKIRGTWRAVSVQRGGRKARTECG